jgi:hypothetical protein
MSYTVEGDVLSLTVNDTTDTFDFTGLPNGRIGEVETTLPINPLKDVFVDEGGLNVVLEKSVPKPQMVRPVEPVDESLALELPPKPIRPSIQLTATEDPEEWEKAKAEKAKLLDEHSAALEEWNALYEQYLTDVEAARIDYMVRYDNWNLQATEALESYRLAMDEYHKNNVVEVINTEAI